MGGDITKMSEGKNCGHGEKISPPNFAPQGQLLHLTSKDHFPEPPDIQHTLEAQRLPPPRCKPRGHNTYAFTYPCSMSHPVFITTAGQLAIPAWLPIVHNCPLKEPQTDVSGRIDPLGQVSGSLTNILTSRGSVQKPTRLA